MPKKTNLKEELRTEIYDLTKSYLARHPEIAFQFALDATDLISSKSTSHALVEWRDSLQNLAEHERGRREYKTPPTKRRATPRKKTAKSRKVKR